MDSRKGVKLVNMIISEGCMEILEFSRDRKPKHFNDFRNLVNPRTNSKFSPKTVLVRVKELVRLGALKKVITKTKRGRDVIGYQITDSGIKALELAKEFEGKLKGVLKAKT